MQVVKMALEILQMHEKIQQQQAEIEDLRHYRAEYIKLLNEDIAHGEYMMGGLMQCVSEALAKARG